jgi:hypothetical protein
MATLHVRNVPEPLYEALRRCADENGRSIASQAVALLNESLSTGRRGFPFWRRRGEGFQAFDDESRSAVVDAQAIVRTLKQDHVDSGHLLLAILSNPASGAAQALAQPPGLLTAEFVRQRLPEGDGPPKGQIPFAPDAKKALELALRESLSTRSRSIETSHLLLGIAGADGPGAAIIAEAALTVGALRMRLLEVPPAQWVKSFRVIELEGSAEEWEEQLAEAAEGPYELREIVGKRAIFELRRP